MKVFMIAALAVARRDPLRSPVPSHRFHNHIPLEIRVESPSLYFQPPFGLNTPWRTV